MSKKIIEAAEEDSDIKAINLHLLKSQHKLQKMTRLLGDQENKTLNRIKLYNKTTSKIVHEKLKQLEEQRKKPLKIPRQFLKHKMSYLIPQKSDFNFKIQNKRESLKSQGSTRSIRSSNSLMSSQKKIQINQLAQSRRISKKQNQENIIKERQKQLKRNLQSAKLIRSSRQNVKSAKERYFNWKIEGVREVNEQKVRKQYKEYIQKYNRIQNLKKMQLMALIKWKKSKQGLGICATQNAYDKIYNN